MRPGFVAVFWLLVLGATSIRVDFFDPPADGAAASASASDSARP